ncbi:MAG: hypothetical protein ABSA91_19575 [Acidimicrobiales bacterium]
MLPTTTPAKPVPSPSHLRVTGLGRHLVSVALLWLGLVPATGALVVLSGVGVAGAVTAPCQPHIAHVGSFAAGKAPDVTITGSCFGAAGAFNGDSDHFRITDLGPHGTISELENAGKIPQTWWNACAGSTDAINGYSPNDVTCDVPSWTNTSVTLRSFGSYYGEDGWVVNAGDKIVVQVWHASSPTDASWCLVDAVAASAPGGGTACSSVVVVGDPVIGGGSKELIAGPDHFSANHKLLPAPLSEGQCQYQEFTDNSYQAQISVFEANCTQADAVGIGAFQARGGAYHGDGFACTATAAGAGSEWASTWVGTYYIYNCKAGAVQIAFNWGPHYDASGPSTSSNGGSGGGTVIAGGGGGSPSGGTDHFGPGHKLLPAPAGYGQCEYQEFSDGSYQAQIAVDDANCTQADSVGIGADKAKGAAYSADGFACKAVSEGAGSEWASRWTGTYYAYDCTAGSEQVAFNWGPHYS